MNWEINIRRYLNRSKICQIIDFVPHPGGLTPPIGNFGSAHAYASNFTMLNAFGHSSVDDVSVAYYLECE